MVKRPHATSFFSDTADWWDSIGYDFIGYAVIGSIVALFVLVNWFQGKPVPLDMILYGALGVVMLYLYLPPSKRIQKSD